MTHCPGFLDRPVLPDAEEVNAATASDLEWHLSPAHPHVFCGGCGNEAGDCHPGKCCTDAEDLLHFLPGVCDLCPDRKLTGQVE